MRLLCARARMNERAGERRAGECARSAWCSGAQTNIREHISSPPPRDDDEGGGGGGDSGGCGGCGTRGSKHEELQPPNLAAFSQLVVIRALAHIATLVRAALVEAAAAVMRRVRDGATRVVAYRARNRLLLDGGGREDACRRATRFPRQLMRRSLRRLSRRWRADRSKAAQDHKRPAARQQKSRHTQIFHIARRRRRRQRQTSQLLAAPSQNAIRQADEKARAHTQTPLILNALACAQSTSKRARSSVLFSSLVVSSQGCTKRKTREQN